MLVSWLHCFRDHSHNTFKHRCHCDMGVAAFWASPFPKPLMIWASPVTLTLSQIAKLIKEGDAHIPRVLGIVIPKTRGCPYHCNTGSGKVFPGSGFEQNTVRDSGSLWLGTGFDCYPGGGIRQNLGTNAGLGKKTISQDGDDGSSGRSILLKRSENAGSAPLPPLFPFSDPTTWIVLGQRFVWWSFLNHSC